MNIHRTDRAIDATPDDMAEDPLFIKGLADLDPTNGGEILEEGTRNQILQVVPELENEEIIPEDILGQIATLEKGDDEKLETLAKERVEKGVLIFTTEKGGKYKGIEGVLSIENARKIAGRINAKRNEIGVQKTHAKNQEKVETKESEKSPEELLAELIEITKGIDNLEKLEEFARNCKDERLLIGGKSEKGWWIKAIKNSKNSQKLVEAILEKRRELAKEERGKRELEGQILKIETFTDMEKLRKHAGTLKHFGHIKIGANGEPIADDQVYGSKEIVDALNAQREKILKEEEVKRMRGSLKVLTEKFGKKQ